MGNSMQMGVMHCDAYSSLEPLHQEMMVAALQNTSATGTDSKSHTAENHQTSDMASRRGVLQGC
jgi:hypothetical protein